MAADIMLLANTIVYDGQLRCGADHVADAVLDLQVAPTQISHPQWLDQVSPSRVKLSISVAMRSVNCRNQTLWLCMLCHHLKGKRCQQEAMLL